MRRCTRIRWVFARRYWGNDYATEPGAASRDYALRTLGCDRVFALIAHENIRSVRVARRIDMHYERDVRAIAKTVQLYAVTA